MPSTIQRFNQAVQSRIVAIAKKPRKILRWVLGVSVLEAIREYYRGKLMEWTIDTLGSFGKWLIFDPFALMTLATAVGMLYLLCVVIHDVLTKDEWTESILVEHGNQRAMIRTGLSKNAGAATIVIGGLVAILIIYGFNEGVNRTV